MQPSDPRLPSDAREDPDTHGDDSDFTIGYGRPPQGSRFKPGRSGNPKGRPRGAMAFKTLLQRELEERVSVKDQGRRRRLSKRGVIVKLVIEDAPIEIAGFSEIELDQIALDEEPAATETGPLEPEPRGDPVSRPGDIFHLGPHRIACGDARDPDLLARLMAGDPARLVLTDVPYNVPIRGHVTGSHHREFAMASGEMSRGEFLAFNAAWIAAAERHLVDGGVLGTFIDWRGYPTIHQAAEERGLEALNLVVWAKTNAGMGSLYRSGHELLPLFRKGSAPHVNNVELGRHGRWRSNVWTYLAHRRSDRTRGRACAPTRPSSRPPCSTTRSST